VFFLVFENVYAKNTCLIILLRYISSHNEDMCLLHVGFHLASSALYVECLIYTQAHCFRIAYVGLCNELYNVTGFFFIRRNLR
jgi:hypothetical protein